MKGGSEAPTLHDPIYHTRPCHFDERSEEEPVSCCYSVLYKYLSLVENMASMCDDKIQGP